jgi:hypothetical protein
MQLMFWRLNNTILPSSILILTIKLCDKKLTTIQETHFYSPRKKNELETPKGMISNLGVISSPLLCASYVVFSFYH